MPARSAGLLMHRFRDGELEILLIHPGGPFWRNKEAGAWSIPKGEIGEDENPIAAARREFEEETGVRPEGELLPLTPIRQKSGKTVYAWALRGDCDAAAVRSNTFTMEWPKGSGRQATFPEVDRAAWFTVPVALAKILPAQAPLVLELERKLAPATSRSSS